MEIIERLPLEAACAHTLLSLEHVHRYECAAALCHGGRVLDLCCGSGYGAGLLAQTAASVVGVDNDAATIDAAGRAIEEPNVAFEVGDAHGYLRRPETSEFDVIVCFEGLEHLHDLDDARASLIRLASSGVKLILSVPNGRAFDDENEFHRTSFDFETATDLFDSIGNTQLLYQFLAEGSLIRTGHPADGPLSIRGQLDEHGEIEWANTFLALVNFAPQADKLLPSGRGYLALAPVHNRYLKTLERANVDLWRTNAKLGRERLGQYDTAATATMVKLRDLERRAQDAESRAALAEQLAGQAQLDADRAAQDAADQRQEVQRLRQALAEAQSGSLRRLTEAIRALRR